VLRARQAVELRLNDAIASRLGKLEQMIPA
jgi:hypothetical protein